MFSISDGYHNFKCYLTYYAVVCSEQQNPNPNRDL